MVVDGRIGFTGGINIDERNCLERQARHRIQDLSKDRTLRAPYWLCVAVDLRRL
jgi:hypothetical protein